ncbi:MAG: NMD3-related protein [Nanoarchaeota archaeon]
MEQKHGNYFEGVLQLRNINDEVIDFAVREIEKDPSTQISTVKEAGDGFDIFITRQKFLRSLGNKLQKQFGGQVVVSRRIFTRNRQTSRDVYRINLLFKLPSFKKGDIIDYRGDKIEILQSHKKVLAKDIKTGRKLNLSFKDLMR